MSESNDGGYADRGGVVGQAGGVAQPGGPDTTSGSAGKKNSAKSGAAKSDKSAGVSTTAKKKSNVVSTYGELLPGARAPVVPGFNYTNRKNQTLQDIQEQNRIGNANFTGNNLSGSQGSAGSVYNPQKKKVVWNPVIRKYVPIPRPKPPVPDWAKLPNFTPEDLPQDYYTHIPGVPLGPVPPNLGNWQVPLGSGAFGTPPGFGTFTGDPSLPGSGPYGDDISDVITGGGSIGSTPGQNPNKDQSQIGHKDPGMTEHSPGNSPGGAGRQFGGPVVPGQQYTVGENGPETLQMGLGGGGQVIPHNPMDQMAGLGGQPGGMSGMGQNPQMQAMADRIRQWWQQQQQQRQQPQGPGMGSPGGPMSGQMPQRPPMPQPSTGSGFGGQMPQPRPFQIGGDLALRHFRGA